MDDLSSVELEKIAHAATEAKAVVERAAAEAKNVITAAASAAINTLMTATAVQSKDIEYLKAAITRIESKLDNLDSRYVSMALYGIIEKRVDELTDLQTQCGKDLVSSKDFDFWRNSLAAAFGATLVAMVGIIVDLTIKR